MERERKKISNSNFSLIEWNSRRRLSASRFNNSCGPNFGCLCWDFPWLVMDRDFPCGERAQRLIEKSQGIYQTQGNSWVNQPSFTVSFVPMVKNLCFNFRKKIHWSSVNWHRLRAPFLLVAREELEWHEELMRKLDIEMEKSIKVSRQSKWKCKKTRWLCWFDCFRRVWLGKHNFRSSLCNGIFMFPHFDFPRIEAFTASSIEKGGENWSGLRLDQSHVTIQQM